MALPSLPSLGYLLSMSTIFLYLLNLVRIQIENNDGWLLDLHQEKIPNRYLLKILGTIFEVTLINKKLFFVSAGQFQLLLFITH